MQPLIVDFESATNSIILRGDTQGVWRSRRTAIFLRDYLKASLLPDGKIAVPAVGARLGPLLRAIEESLVKGGFQVTRTPELADSVADFQRAEDQFRQFSDRAKTIWA